MLAGAAAAGSTTAAVPAGAAAWFRLAAGLAGLAGLAAYRQATASRQ